MEKNGQLRFVTALTLARVPLVLLFMACALAADGRRAGGGAALALGALIAASLTDLFDGWLARRWRVTTPFGAMADPLMDKVFYLVVFPTLTFLLARRGGAEGPHALAMLIFTVCYLLRDQWVTFLRAAGAGMQMNLGANWMGKLRTAFSFPLGCLLYLYLAWSPAWLPRNVLLAAEAAGLLLNLASMAVYTRQYWPALQHAMALK